MEPETATDKVLDKIVEVCRDVKSGNQIQGLWKVFNLMTAFIKGQANLISAMDRELKGQRQELERLKADVDRLKHNDGTPRITKIPVGPVQ